MSCIKASAFIIGQEGEGSVDLSTRAAEQCIANAGIEKNDVDLLINIGVYRDNNILEPSMASLIQRQIGLNLDPVQNPMGQSTFAFDIMNGACGFLHAVQVINAFLKNNTVNTALLVSSNSHPSKQRLPEFPFSPVGGAMLFTRPGQDDQGFRGFSFKTSQGDYGVEGNVNVFAHGAEARKNVTIVIQEDYADRLLEFATATATEFFSSRSLETTEIKHVVVSQPVAGFAKKIAAALGLDDESTIDIYDEYGDTHSSALMIGYHLLSESNSIARSDLVLFLGAGSGLTAACGLYQA